MKICRPKNGGNSATTVQSGVTVALTSSCKQTAHCLNTLTNLAYVAGVNGEGLEIVWQKREEEVYGTASYSVKEASLQ